MERRRSPSYTRSGLPRVCGGPLPDGTECTRIYCDADHRSALVFDPVRLLNTYELWFTSRYPTTDPHPTMAGFVRAWHRDQRSSHPQWPVITLAGLADHIRRWLEDTGQPSVLPYDVALFIEALEGML